MPPDLNGERRQLTKAGFASAKEAAAARAEILRQHEVGTLPKDGKLAVPRPFGATTAQRVHATLRAALNSAVRAEDVARNVAVFADRPSGARPKVRPWEPKQLGAWLDWIAGERLYALYHLGALPGLRRGELCGLDWSERRGGLAQPSAHRADASDGTQCGGEPRPGPGVQGSRTRG